MARGKIRPVAKPRTASAPRNPGTKQATKSFPSVFKKSATGNQRPKNQNP